MEKKSPIINSTDIGDIEARVDLDDIEVIPSLTRAHKIYSNMVKSDALCSPHGLLFAQVA